MPLRLGDAVIAFQSTLSVRRATRAVQAAAFNNAISIHALRKESDIQARESAITAYEFQSTLSRKESDPAFYWNAKSQEISIPALRKESDFACAGILPLHPYFNPRSP